jgi:hypothetical protein
MHSKRTQDAMQILSQQRSSFTLAQNIFIIVARPPLGCLGCVKGEE